MTSAWSAGEKYVLQASDPFVSFFSGPVLLSVFVHLLCTDCTAYAVHSVLLLSLVPVPYRHDRHDIPVTLPCLGAPDIPGD